MKNYILVIGGVCIFVNILLGLILTVYQPFSVALNCAVIAINMVLLYVVNTIKLKDAYCISLNCVFPTFALIEFIIGLFSKQDFNDNMALVAIIVLLFVEGIALVSTSVASKHV